MEKRVKINQCENDLLWSKLDTLQRTYVKINEKERKIEWQT